MTKGGTLGDLLSADAKNSMYLSNVSEGAVYRMKLDVREKIIPKNPGDDSRNKYFIAIGKDSEGNALGFFLIDTKINGNLPQSRKDMHLKLSAAKYAFLEGVDRYADCSDFKMISKERFSQMFESDKEKGIIDASDIAEIKNYATSYKNANKVLLKRFGILPE